MSNRPYITTGRIARDHPLARLGMAAAVLISALAVGSALAAPAAAETGGFSNETTNGTASGNISDMMPAFDRDDNRPMMPALEEDEGEVGDDARSFSGSQWNANDSATPGDFTTAPETG